MTIPNRLVSEVWLYRYQVLEAVLEGLGYSCKNIAQGDVEVLDNVLKKSPEQIVHDCQMERTPNIEEKQ